MSDFFSSGPFGGSSQTEQEDLPEKKLVDDSDILQRGDIDLVTALLRYNRGVMVAGLESELLPFKFMNDNIQSLAAMGVRQIFITVIPADKQSCIDRFVEDNDDNLTLRMQLDKLYPIATNLPKTCMDLIKTASDFGIKVLAIGSTWEMDMDETPPPGWVKLVDKDVAALREYDRFLVIGDNSMLFECFDRQPGDCRSYMPTIGLMGGLPEVTMPQDERGDYVMIVGSPFSGDGGGRGFKQTRTQRMGVNPGQGGRGGGGI